MNPVSDRTQSSTPVEPNSTDISTTPVVQPVDAAAVAKLKQLVSSQSENQQGQSDSSDSSLQNLLSADPSLLSLLQAGTPGTNTQSATRVTPVQPVNSKSSTSGSSAVPKVQLVSPFEVSSSAQNAPSVQASTKPSSSTSSSATSSALESDEASELASNLFAPTQAKTAATNSSANNTTTKHSDTDTDTDPTTQNLVNPVNASVQQIANSQNPTVSPTPNAPAATQDHSDVINAVADQILVSEPKQGSGAQVQIRLNQDVLPDTQVTLKQENGQLSVNFVTGAQSSSDLLSNGAETLANRLASIGSVPVVVTVQQAGATDGLLASVTAQAQTGSDQGGFGRSRGRQWSEQATDEGNASS